MVQGDLIKLWARNARVLLRLLPFARSNGDEADPRLHCEWIGTVYTDTLRTPVEGEITPIDLEAVRRAVALMAASDGRYGAAGRKRFECSGPPNPCMEPSRG